MAELVIHRVNALPSELKAHSLYIVKRQEYGLAEMVFTSEQAEPLKVLDRISVQTMISAEMSKTAGIKIVADIQERDSLALEGDATVYVVDASADEEVNDGSALYFYTKATDSFTLIICAKKTSWNDLTSKPESSIEAIDAAVQKAHAHENEEVLNGLEDVDGSLHYKGKPVSTIVFESSDW